jgi:hypothetical protein
MKNKSLVITLLSIGIVSGNTLPPTFDCDNSLPPTPEQCDLVKVNKSIKDIIQINRMKKLKMFEQRTKC